MDSFGKRLRAARRAMFERTGKEPTQGEVGAIVGVKPNAASAWEGDVSTPPIEAIPAIAAFLGVTPGWLAFGQEPRYATISADDDDEEPELAVTPVRRAKADKEPSPKQKKKPA